MTQNAGAGPRPDGLGSSRRQRREAMLAAALAALDGTEYEQIRIRQVAEAAGVALGTLYRHFASKEVLYASALVEWANSGPEMASARDLPAHLAPEDLVRARLHGILSGFEQCPRYYRLHVLLRTASDTNAAELIAQTERQTRAALTKDLGSMEPLRARDTALMLWAITDTVLLEAIIRGGGMAAAYRVVDRFIDLLSTPLRWSHD